jgi:hypothetical protein
LFDFQPLGSRLKDHTKVKKQKGEMNRLLIAFSIATILTGCNPTKKTTKMEERKNETINAV